LGVLLYEDIAECHNFYLAIVKRFYFNRHQIFVPVISKSAFEKHVDLVPLLHIVTAKLFKFYRNNIFPYYSAHFCSPT